MTTIGELSTIMQELKLIHMGDAADYLGEEPTVDEESQSREQEMSLLSNDQEEAMSYGYQPILMMG